MCDALAWTSRADAIITGDRHLLEMAESLPFAVLIPAELVARL